MESITEIINNFFRFFIRLVRKVLNISIRVERYLIYILARVERQLISNEYIKTNQKNKIIQSTKYDMVVSPDEPYYQEQYWHWIKKYLESSRLLPSGTYLDLGCGQGRLSMPIAKWCSKGGKVIGVDFSDGAINQARQYAARTNIKNIDYIQEDILKFAQSRKDASFDAVFLLEVTFFMPEYLSVLKEIKRILKPNGLLFASFRPQYFNALCMARSHNWNNIDMLLERRMGRLYGGDICFTWQTSGEVVDLIGKELDFDILNVCAIGCCSGIGGDPHDSIARPSYLDEDEKKKIMELEIALAESVLDAGRYILCIARKKII